MDVIPLDVVVIRWLVSQLKNTHLPDLRTLHDDCLWLTSKLELKDKKGTSPSLLIDRDVYLILFDAELQPSETRLLQFVAAVSATVSIHLAPFM